MSFTKSLALSKPYKHDKAKCVRRDFKPPKISIEMSLMGLGNRKIWGGYKRMRFLVLQQAEFYLQWQALAAGVKLWLPEYKQCLSINR